MNDLFTEVPLDWPWEVEDSALRREWFYTGKVIKAGLLPDGLIDAYCDAYEKAGVGPRGWPTGTPYMSVPALRDLCCYGPLVDVLDELVGEPVALHLNLTGWVSTERAWHQDAYLNPDFVASRYAAVWMALDDIAADAGPFQYVPGSHRWPVITRDTVFSRLSVDQRSDPDWPLFTEEWIAPAWEEAMAERDVGPESFLARRGDVLIWHDRLVHRGSPPAVPGKQRKAAIAHYSGVNHRHDMTSVLPWREGRVFAFGALA